MCAFSSKPPTVAAGLSGITYGTASKAAFSHSDLNEARRCLYSPNRNKKFSCDRVASC
jgi:hypothetical protein